MGITPIEMYTMVPKSQEASNVKQATHSQEQAAQSNIVSHVQTVAKQNSVQTVKASESQKEEYRYDAKEKGNGSFSGNKGKKKEEEEKDSKAIKNTSPRKGGFDVRI